MKSKILILFYSIFILLSCSKDDSNGNQINQNGGQVSRFQIVKISTGNMPLTENTYDALFNDEPVQLAKSDTNELVFYVPETTPLGANTLKITSLNNAEVNYQVVDVVLQNSAETTIQPIMTLFTNTGQNLPTEPQFSVFAQNYQSTMNYMNGLSDNDKEEVAKFYFANKELIDAVFNTDYSVIQGKNNLLSGAEFDFDKYKSLIRKYKKSLAIALASTAVAILEPSNAIRPFAIGIAGFAIYKATDFHNQITEDVFRVIGIKVDEMFGVNNRNNNAIQASALSFVSGQDRVLPFQVNTRNFINADASVEKEMTKLFFDTKNGLNSFITSVNNAIVWVNSNIPFVNFNSLPLVDVTNSSPNTLFNVNSQLMQKVSFTINHPNLKLDSATLSNTGQLTAKVSLVGNPATLPVTSVLNYTYNDEFNSFTGTIPITVSGAPAQLVSAEILGYESVGVGSCSQNATVIFKLKFNTTTPTSGSISGFSTWTQNGVAGSGNPFQFPINQSFEIGSDYVIVKRPCCWTLPGDTIGRRFNYITPEGVATNEIYIFVPRP